MLVGVFANHTEALGMLPNNRRGSARPRMGTAAKNSAPGFAESFMNNVGVRVGHNHCVVLEQGELP